MTPGPFLIPESEPCVQDCSPSLVGAGTAPITLSKVMIRPLGGAVPTALHPHPRPRRYLPAPNTNSATSGEGSRVVGVFPSLQLPKLVQISEFCYEK